MRTKLAGLRGGLEMSRWGPALGVGQQGGPVPSNASGRHVVVQHDPVSGAAVLLDVPAQAAHAAKTGGYQYTTLEGTLGLINRHRWN